MEAIPWKQKAINACGHLRGFRGLWLLGSVWDVEEQLESGDVGPAQLSFATFN